MKDPFPLHSSYKEADLRDAGEIVSGDLKPLSPHIIPFHPLASFLWIQRKYT